MKADESSPGGLRVPSRIGKYDVRDLIGRGGMGAVFKGYQADLDRTVAIKVLISGEHASPEQIERFMREARASAKLVHPYIVQIHDVGSDNALHYIVMEHVNGKSVADWMQLQPFSVEQAMKIAYFAARALEFAHDNGVIHRDIKPSNIIVDQSGRIRLLDFGLSKVLNDGQATLTRSGTVLGTPAYMSPEQAFGDVDEVDARSDLYGLGAVLYEMLTGRPPFPGENVFSVLRKIEEDEPDPPTSVKPGIPYEVEAICLKALAKKKTDRFKSAADMAAAIQHFFGNEPSMMTPPPMERGVSRRNIVMAAAVIAPTLLALGAFAAYLMRSPPPKPNPPANNGTPAERLQWAQALYDDALALTRPGQGRLRVEKLKDAHWLVSQPGGDVEHAILCARVLRKLGQYGKSASTMKAALDERRDPRLLFEYALALSFERARLRPFWLDAFWEPRPSAELDKIAVDLSPTEQPWYSMTQGLMQTARGNYAPALREFDRVLSTQSGSPEYMALRGMNLALQGARIWDGASAERAQFLEWANGDVESALALDANEPLIVFALGFLRIFRPGDDQPQSVADDLQRCSDRTPEIAYMRALILYHSGGWEPRRNPMLELRDSNELSPDVDTKLHEAWCLYAAPARRVEALDSMRGELDAILSGESPPYRAWLLRALIRHLRAEVDGAFDPGLLDDYARFGRDPAAAEHTSDDPLRAIVEPAVGLGEELVSEGGPTPAKIYFVDTLINNLNARGWNAVGMPMCAWIISHTEEAIADMEEEARREYRRSSFYRWASVLGQRLGNYDLEAIKQDAAKRAAYETDQADVVAKLQSAKAHGQNMEDVKADPSFDRIRERPEYAELVAP